MQKKKKIIQNVCILQVRQVKQVIQVRLLRQALNSVDYDYS